MLCPLWMGVSVSLVEHFSALITLDGCVSALISVDWCDCVYGGTFQCPDHCGFVGLYLWRNMSVL